MGPEGEVSEGFVRDTTRLVSLLESSDCQHSSQGGLEDCSLTFRASSASLPADGGRGGSAFRLLSAVITII